MRKSDITAGGPVNHAAGYRRRLAQQRDIAHQRPGSVEAGIDVGCRHHIAKMVGTL